jgi:hypothetical protein
LQLEVNIWNELCPSVFTIASVDNFDKLQSHSAVCPALVVKSSISSAILSDINDRRRHSDVSPANSPHKLGKIGPKRRRTIAVSQLPGSITSISLPQVPYSQQMSYQHL